MRIIRRIFDYKGAVVLTVAFAILFVAEGRRTLRKRKQPRMKRAVINSAVAVPAFSLLRLLLLPVMVKLAMKNNHWKFGLNHWLPTPPLTRSVLTFLALDYTNYIWHVLLHKLPVLWRFHLVHHTDLDLDVTTAFRFHFGEIIASVLFRGGAVVLIGASPRTVIIYEIAFEAATQFHHSNMKLPFALEKMLNYVIVTPRMHGIHHSVVRNETDSNYSIIFSVWDRLSKTIRLNVHQDQVVTGVANYTNANELSIANLLKLPFTTIRKSTDTEKNTGGNAGRMLP